MADLFEQLDPFKWRGVEFPITKMRLSLAHDLVEHKYWGVNGARIEATGVAPIRIHASIPLYNTIVPGKKEKWDPNQYPQGLRKLMSAFGKRETGILHHPEFGEILCKADKLEIDWDANRRGGVEAEASWVETIVIEEGSLFAIGQSPVREIELAALDLDASNTDLARLVSDRLNELGLDPAVGALPDATFASFARGITSITDQAALISMRFAGKIDAIVYRAETFGDSVDRAKSALTWPVTQNLERLKSASFGLREKLIALNRSIVVARTPADTTLGGLAASTPSTKLSDLVSLNPQLVRSPVIPKDTSYRYYV